MSLQDPISDFITTINNAQKRTFKSVSVPYSRIKESIARILLNCGYISGVDISGDSPGTKRLNIDLKYFAGSPVIHDFKRVSKLSRRVYSTSDSLPVVRDGLGEAIITTNKGVMTANEARALNLGGEIICTVF